MNEFLGWFCTISVLYGFFLNSRQNKLAFYVWILGDIGWIIYDYNINNFSHLTLCVAIIALNIYGIYFKKTKG